ncbi:MAG: DEAD/DEAH box helicase [Actinomycetia bacterium]|nr:DEAD/DEAH box helicase [Actinomycetes bacterium]
MIAAALPAQGIDGPFPIQAATLPDSLSGRDVLGRGRTGSGKTIAFAVPTLSALAASGRRRQKGSPRALILVPTRELAAQVAAAIVPLSDSLGLRSMTVYGGVSQGPQVSKLAAGVDVCIATPGRLEDLIGQGRCRLADVEVTVLDEADHMADLGFLPAVKRLLDQTPRDGQRLLFSATLDNGIDQIVRRYLHDPITHSVDSETSHVPDMEHHAFVVEQRHKADVVRRLVSGRGRTLAFTRTKHGAKALARKLTAAGVPAVDLHGNLSQGARQRNLEAFGWGRVRVLFATYIAARGIHVDDVGLVVHVDPPSEHKAYLHRSGRTARAGAKGRVVTVMTHEQRRDVRQLMRRASIKPVIADVAPDSGKIVELTGPLAERVDPAEAALRTAAAPSANGSNRNRNQNRSSSNNRNRGGNRRRGNRSRR